jgi:hypothetical protein
MPVGDSEKTIALFRFYRLAAEARHKSPPGSLPGSAKNNLFRIFRLGELIVINVLKIA